MNTKKIVNMTIMLLCMCLAVGVGAFIYNATDEYKISNTFISLPLSFNPEDSSSKYQMKNVTVTVYGGFVKGFQKNKDGTKTLVIRALSPLPTLTVKSEKNESISVIVENINPAFYAKSIEKSGIQTTKIEVNTLQLTLAVTKGAEQRIEPANPGEGDRTGKYKYIILGDNRDGYGTFQTIIEQANGVNPVFVIGNGDLVFSGKPNQYRLFDKVTSKLATTMCTTLGNHDIRGGGRDIYTTLYGPAYYSFDFSDSHFIFLDSSPGWAQKQAITDEQYLWLEKDLVKAQGKKIIVISHIPPQDPRSGVTKNEIANYVNKVKNGDNWAEQKLDNYIENKNMEHGFQDPVEAEKFESLMSTYHVDTVYLSHIHSYFEYYKDGVRYLISGGAGAELLTENSYYHYMIADFTNTKSITMVELPSPANNYISRFLAAAQLFAKAMYEENPVAVGFVLAGFVLLLILLLVKLYLWRKQPFETLGRWLYDVVRFAGKRFRELFFNKHKE